MVEETGTVIRVEGGMAWVLVQKKSACEGCQVKGACESVSGGMEIEALNPVHAQAGQTVKVLMAPQQYLKGSMIVYGFPLVLFVAGAIAGKNIGEKYFRELDSDLLAAVAAFASLILSLIGVKIWSRRLDRDSGYKPVIEAVIH